MSDNDPGLRLLVVDDDDLFRETLAQNLEDDGFAVSEARNGDEALQRLSDEEAPDGIILDWNMPGLNGLQTLRKLRESGCETPVLFLTGHNDQIYEESALESGAADFVDKSRSYAILKMRLDKVFAPAALEEEETDAPAPSENIEIGPLTLRGESKRALWKNQEVNLTVSEFDIVHFLARSPGKDIKFREIYDIVHGKGFWAGHGEDGYRTNVRTFIKRIRKKFRDTDPDFDAIENYPGFGYRWAAAEK